MYFICSANIEDKQFPIIQLLQPKKTGKTVNRYIHDESVTSDVRVTTVG